ncbi:hypothetical protein INT80_12015 [Gallibacterium anatis]|uniref:Uncharacterized protein n=1 Tax=Gallibacterium anatis TaxID=750 RepID=A0A930Y5E8_9PAST|nr:hypothetical protein [Gallibacterium anatis]
MKSISEASNASITSPEQGAQQEWSSNLLCPPGKTNFGRTKGAFGSLATFFFFLWE